MSTRNKPFFLRYTNFLHSDFGRSLIIAILWQSLLFVISVLALHVFAGIENHTMPNTDKSILSYTLNWDGQWYQSIIDGSYSNIHSPSPAFFPGYPLLVLLINKVTFGIMSIPVIALLINTLCVTGAVYFLKKISSIVIPKVNPWIAPVVFLLSPAAIFMHEFYTEALLCVVGFAAYYFALQKKWLVTCLILAAATGIKLAALLFIGLCFLEYLKSHNWNLKQSIKDKRLLYFFITPLGLLAYSVFLYLARNDALAMFHSIDAWAYHQFNPNILHTIASSAHHVLQATSSTVSLDNIMLVNFILPLISIAATLVASIYAICRLKNVPLGVFGFVSIVFFTLNNNLVSVHRYLLPIFVVYVVIAHMLHNGRATTRTLLWICVYGGVLMQSVLIILFSTYNFAG